MAIVERNLAQEWDYSTDPPEDANLFASYDDQALRITRVRIHNRTTLVARVTAQRANGTGQRVELDCPAATRDQDGILVPGELVQNVGVGQNQRFDVTVDRAGKISGVDWSFGLVR